MMIYEPMVAEGYEWVNCLNGADYEVFASFDGSPRAQGWKPVVVSRVRVDGRESFKASDFPWLGGHALMMGRKAVEALTEILKANGEILPLATLDGTELFVLNVTRVLDAINVKQSEIVRFPNSERIMQIKSIAFVEELVRSADIFRLPHRASSTYVSERFVKAVSDAKLEGLEFEGVWDSSAATHRR